MVNFIAFNFLYDAFHRGVVSVVAPIAYTYPVVTTVLSVLILRTIVSTGEALAISAVVFGVVLLSTRFTELGSYIGGKGAPGVRAGALSAVGSSIFFGIAYLGIGYAAPSVSYVLPAVILRAVGTLVGFAAAPFLRQDVKPSRLALSNTIFAIGFLESIGFLAFTYGILAAGGSLPVVTALSGLGGAVATSYAMVFLKERLETNQVIGVLLAVAGVFLLLYLGG